MQNKSILAILVVAIVVGGVVYAFNETKTKEVAIEKGAMQNEIVQGTGEAMLKSPAQDKLKDDLMQNIEPQQSDKMMKKDEMQTPGSYVDYNSDTIESLGKAGGKIVLFFHAPWCPFCREADSAFKSNISQIPANVVVVKTDYDSNAELKKKYAVTTQHTFVQVDSSGNMVTKWIGGDIANLQKYIK